MAYHSYSPLNSQRAWHLVGAHKYLLNLKRSKVRLLSEPQLNHLQNGITRTSLKGNKALGEMKGELSEGWFPGPPLPAPGHGTGPLLEHMFSGVQAGVQPGVDVWVVPSL